MRYLGEVDSYVMYSMCKIFLPACNSAKITKIDRDFPDIMITKVLPPFYGVMVYGV